MSNPRKHHYIPVSYQKLFWDSQNQKISVLDLNTGKSFSTNPNNVGSERDLYRSESTYPESGKNTHIENPILSAIDGNFPVELNSIIFNEPESVNKLDISIFIGFLAKRTPSAFNQVKVLADKYFKEKLFWHIRDKYSSNLPLSPINTCNKDDFLDELSQVKILPGNDTQLAIMLGGSICLAEYFYKSKWRLFHSIEGKFITSDNPVTAVNDENLQYYLIPLSSHWNLQIGHGLDTKTIFALASNEDINYANSRLVEHAKSQIFGSSILLLEDLYKQVL